jgi:hypothetical protein
VLFARGICGTTITVIDVQHIKVIGNDGEGGKEGKGTLPI